MIGKSSSTFLKAKVSKCISPSITTIIMNLISFMNIPGFGIVINIFLTGFKSSK